MKKGLIFTAIWVVCFGLNIYIHHSPIYSLLNSFLLLLGIWHFPKSLNTIYLLGLATIPILTWSSSSVIPGLFVIVFEIFFICGIDSKGILRKIFFSFAVITFSISLLLTGGILRYEGSEFGTINKEQLFIYQTDSVTSLEKTTGTFQTDLWGKGIPFTRSKYVHNMSVSIFNRFFRNLTEFLYLPNFYQTILLANLYLILLGMLCINNNQAADLKILLYTFFGIFIIVVGISLHMGKNASVYPLIPVFIFLAGQGIIKSRLPVYVGLLIFQLLLLGWG